jgi:4-hydroxyphenylpyruvate dioxygenase
MSTTVVEPQKTTSVADRLKAVQQSETDFLPLQGTDYVEFYVGNAKQAAHYYKTAFGFQSLAYSGPETGNKETARYVIRQNKLTIMLTTPLRPNNAIADHIYKHGDGVKVLALKVEDATSAWNETTSRGGKSYMEPTDAAGRERPRRHERHPHLRRDGHLFIERGDYNGVFMPGFQKWESHYNPPETGCSTSTIASATSDGTR